MRLGKIYFFIMTITIFAGLKHDKIPIDKHKPALHCSKSIYISNSTRL